MHPVAMEHFQAQLRLRYSKKFALEKEEKIVVCKTQKVDFLPCNKAMDN